MFAPRLVSALLVAAALLGIGVAPLRADQTDARLDALFDVLRNTETPEAAHVAEVEIWHIWIESGRADIDALMAEGIRAMSREDLDDAITIFGQITERAPQFAEGWNKRATAYFLNEDYVASVEDIRVTLALEPRHFGAISGMGLIFLSQGDEAGALEAFEAVLAIHPHAPYARQRVEELRQRLRDRGA